VNAAVGLLLVALLIVANGAFVAAEFSLVSVGRAALEDRVATGSRRARMVVRERSDLAYTLAVAQFAITATSLLLGYVADRTIGATIVRPLLERVGLPGDTSLAVVLVATLLLSTMVQMVLGELFPKNLAISRPLGVALAVAPMTRLFGLVVGPLVRLFDAAAQWITRRVFRVEIAQEMEGGHSLDELARIVSASGEEGSLTDQQTELLQRAIGLGDRRVSEVMVPRPDVVWLQGDETLQDLRDAARRTGHSRFPLRGATEDDVLGTVHVKDLLTVPADRHADTPLLEVADTMLAVPESESLRRLLGELRREQRTFALAVDEYGGTAGIVTVEDVLEQLVGDISDEFDRRSDTEVRRVGAGRYLVAGTLRVPRVAELFDVELPDGEYETLAGFVLDQLGHIPEPGERVTFDRIELTVLTLVGVRITEIALRVLEPPGQQPPPDGSEVAP
jgi:CBS domain containing-hemolysin-like protein